MESNSIEWALEQTFIDFNDFLRNTPNWVKHTIIDQKNAFIQRLKANLKCTDIISKLNISTMSNVLDSIKADNIELIIEHNILLDCTFTNKKNIFYGERLANLLNDTLKTIDYSKYSFQSQAYGPVYSAYSRTIHQINNFKIK